MYRFRSFLATSATFVFIMLFALFWCKPASASTAQQPEPADKAASQEAAKTMLANLSNDQIRQLLIDELQKDAGANPQSSTTTTEVKGPATFLARLLNTLDRESVQSENQLEAIHAAIPKIVPDLYKVFVSL